MRKLFITVLILIPCSVLAVKNQPEVFAGIKLVSLEQLSVPDEIKKQQTAKDKQFKQKGYVEISTPYPKQLLNVRKIEKNVLETRTFAADPYDTHIKANLNDIRLSFSFSGIPVKSEYVIGFAPIGSWEDKGWNGIKEYFSDNNLGICTYTKVKIIGIEINREIVTKEVNNKISTKYIEGNGYSGYSYMLNWYEDQGKSGVQSYELECANMKFDKGIMTKMIALASQIDRKI